MLVVCTLVDLVTCVERWREMQDHAMKHERRSPTVLGSPLDSTTKQPEDVILVVMEINITFITTQNVQITAMYSVTFVSLSVKVEEGGGGQWEGWGGDVVGG